MEILLNFDKLPCLEGTFLEMSYFSVFRHCKLIIYRPDELFQIFLQILYLPMDLDIW